jgi:y4mF family transcriptional regulator
MHLSINSFSDLVLYANEYIFSLDLQNICIYIYSCLTLADYILLHTMKNLAEFVKERRKQAQLTQEAFAARVGVALTVVRKIEQGKTNMSLAKVNLVLSMFGHELAPVSSNDLKTSPKK